MTQTMMKNTITFFSFILAFTCCCAPGQLVSSEPALLLRTQLDNNSGGDIMTTTTTISSANVDATTIGAKHLTESDADQEPPVVTSIAPDSLGVNSDETGGSIVINGDEVSTAKSTDDNDGASVGAPEMEGIIESKSINGAESAGANSLSFSTGNSNAKLLSIKESEDNDGDNSDDSPHPKPKQAKPIEKVNLTQVDKFYEESHKGEQETVESWHRMNRKMKKAMGNIIGYIVPLALNISQEAQISSNCSGAMLKWVLSMNQLKLWALRMLDASGKPIAGLLEGSMTLFGNYRQCLKIRAPDDDEIEFAGEFREYFRGKYCVIQAKPWLPEKSRFYNLNTKIKALMEQDEGEEPSAWYEKTVLDELSEWALAFNFLNIRFDLCVPSLCSREDIHKTVNFLVKGIDLKARVLRCETDAVDSGAFGASYVESGSPDIPEALAGAAAVPSPSTDPSLSPQQQQKDYQSTSMDAFSQLGWILVPASSIALVLIATALSVAMDDETKRTNKLKHTIKSLSLKRSIKSHLSVDYDQLADDKPLALYGIRFILVLWVVVVESAINLKFEYLRELLMLKDLIFMRPMQILINSTLQFDSLILLTAFTMSYKNCLNDGINNARAITKYVLDKYVRLMPSIMVMVALVILLPLTYRGPVWNDYVARQSAVCQSTGWINTVFLQNYLPYKEICLPQTWLFCVELQLVLLMAPLVYYLNKDYISNFEGNKNINDDSGMTRLGLVGGSTTSRRQHNAHKLFYWFWTVPGTILIGCIALGLAGSFYNVYSNDLPPSWLYTMADPDSKAIYFGDHFIRLWTHLAVFAIGILAGIECRRATRNVIRGYRSANIGLASSSHNGLKYHKNHHVSSTSLPVISQSDSSSSKSHRNEIDNSNSNSNISINIHTNNNSREDINGVGGNDDNSRSLCSIIRDVIGCLMAITTMTTIIFSTHDWSLNDLPKPLVAGIYDAGSRFLWSLALIWMLYMVSVPDKNRKFSFLARLLGNPAMVCLGKLSFLIYLIHPFVHTAVLAIQEQPIYSSWLMLFHILLGNITITVILSSLVSLFVEMPCRNLFRRCGTSLLLAHTVGSPSATASTTDTTATTTS